MFGPPAQVRSQRAFVFIVLLLALVALPRTRPGRAASDLPEGVIAIGDVHGDFDDFVSILQHEHLIDAAHHWTGGKITLVQVGDLLDRIRGGSRISAARDDPIRRRAPAARNDSRSRAGLRVPGRRYRGLWPARAGRALRQRLPA